MGEGRGERGRGERGEGRGERGEGRGERGEGRGERGEGRGERQGEKEGQEGFVLIEVSRPLGMVPYVSIQHRQHRKVMTAITFQFQMLTAMSCW